MVVLGLWLFRPLWSEIHQTLPTIQSAVKQIQSFHEKQGSAMEKEDIPTTIAKHIQNRDPSFTVKYQVDSQTMAKYKGLKAAEKREKMTEEFDRQFRKMLDHALREHEYLEHVIEKYTCKWTYSEWNEEVILQFDEIVYRESKEETDAVDEKVEQIVDKLIEPDMTEYQKVKTIHDYIVNHVKYVLRDNGRESNTAYSALFDGESACYGYSMLAFKMLKQAGIDAHIVTGKAISDFNGGKPIGHAWNLVKVKGNWYHMDATFDDPIGPTDAQKPFYDYFLISDKRIKKNHFWNPAEQKYDMPMAKTTYPR
jgi:transglutaminase-like putative cysteine protease